MLGNVIQGALLVLASWVFILLVASAFGRSLAVVLTWRAEVTQDYQWRVGLWSGLTLITAVTLALSLLLPLGGSTAAIVTLGVGLIFAIVGSVLRRLKRVSWTTPSLSVVVWLVSAWAAITYLGAKALGPVTNYDSGLYHLGSIKYAADYSAIPGVANLYFPFGYANAQFPLAALLGNGPWDGIGYRLLNGAILVLVLVDLTSRLMNRRWSWGTFTLLFGLSATLIPMVAMADDMVTSPTADTSVMLLTLVAASYLADTLEEGGSAQSDALMAIMVAGLTVAFRPTMIVFAVGVLVVVTIFIWRKRLSLAPRPQAWVMTAALLSILAAVSLLRDRTLSGWLFYPLSTFPLQVPWLAEDPTRWRIGTLAAARDPNSLDGFQTAHSYNWIPQWLERLPSQWEPWFLLVGLLIVSSTLLVAWKRGAMRGAWSRVLLALLPSVVAVVAWFLLSPPSFRFIWGPIFIMLVLPMGIAFAQMREVGRGAPNMDVVARLALIAGAVCIGFVSVFSLIERNQFDTITQQRLWQVGPVSFAYATTPVPLPATAPIDVGNDLIVFTPSNGDQCWDNYPLCVYYTGQSVSARGQSIQDGFNYE